MAQPSHLATAISELSSLSDEIWFLCGDVSVDTSWYTKRASLSMIYAAIELFMTTDKSPDFNDTREFLDRRFEDVQIVGGAVGSMAQWAGFTAQAGLNVLRSKVSLSLTNFIAFFYQLFQAHRLCRSRHAHLSRELCPSTPDAFQSIRKNSLLIRRIGCQNMS